MSFFDFLRSKPNIPTQSVQIRYIPHVAMTQDEQAMMWGVVFKLGDDCVFIGSRCLAMQIGTEFIRNLTVSDFNFIMSEKALTFALKEFKKIFELRGPPPANIQNFDVALPEIEKEVRSRRVWLQPIAPTLPERPKGTIVIEGESWHGGPAFVIREILNDGSSIRLITAGVRE